MSPKALNPNALKWVEALESGAFNQGRHHLTKGDEHCCLGVACVVAMQNGVTLDVDVGKEKEDGVVVTHYDGTSSILPDKVRNWLGLRTNGAYCTVDSREEEQLTALNDRGVTFAELATLIRSKPEGLFRE